MPRNGGRETDWAETRKGTLRRSVRSPWRALDLGGDSYAPCLAPRGSRSSLWTCGGSEGQGAVRGTGVSTSSDENKHFDSLKKFQSKIKIDCLLLFW